jgi:hypothetical protein
MKHIKQLKHIKKICLLLAVVALVFQAGACDSDPQKPAPPAAGDKVVKTAPAAPCNKIVKTAPVAPVAPGAAAPIAFVGTFDPYLFKDKEITDRVVMKERPECGSCHIKGSLTGNRLDLVVKSDTQVYNWTLQGQPEGKEIVFTKGKLRIVLKDNKLTGKFTGDMQGKINLARVAGEYQ